MDGDADLSLVHFLTKNGHTLEYALNLSGSERLLLLGIIKADLELEARKRGDGE